MTAQQTSTGPFSPLRLSTGTVHPFHIYGTAFKEGRTGELTALALRKGFRGLDSANYPSAYEEAAVGVAIEEAVKSGVKREDLFVIQHQQPPLRPRGSNIDKWGKNVFSIQVQTKFTPMWAHAESKLPYNADQPLEEQVRESIEQSFQNLKVDYIDALLLHVPFPDEQDNTAAWRVMESFVPSRVGVLGVSNFGRAALQKLYAAATVKPEIVQNRFQAENGYDGEIREYLGTTGVVYQAFSLLKANREIRSSELVARVAERFHTERETAFYVLVLGLGRVSIVNGTTSEAHMEMDLAKIAELLGDQQAVSDLTEYLVEFKQLLRTK
ncbi:aldo-keto reductase (AKR), putative [Metarhizium acridum CQMa 102]|uniref:Aldo-keto reductase (AKR), putative n=2 Tax=Metarhizium acridum TaxID=92637 RepID=E9EIF1_METAQ|nr:aldo-keto reductase (AKR), putative [Metarhizium acridum CQMa 102]EFY84298.1 aldo-keto reductase (AKR), putative [Metarhizium acridum CQMa 102]